MIFGGQIKGEAMRLFLVYSTGNFIEATSETCYFQIGEAKYGKPVLDRMIVPGTPLAQAAKCVLVSIDSTLKSNLSVGLPIDLVVYKADSLHSDEITCIDEANPYFAMIRGSWGERLRQAFDGLDDPNWDSPSALPAQRHFRALPRAAKNPEPQREDHLAVYLRLCDDDGAPRRRPWDPAPCRDGSLHLLIGGRLGPGRRWSFL